MKMLRAVFCLFLLCSSLYAGVPPGFTVAAEWLYMLHAESQPYWSGSITFPVSHRFPIEQRWHSGFRLEGWFGSCEGIDGVGIRWTHFPRFTERDRQDNVEATQGFAAEVFNTPATNATERARYTFHTLEALYKHEIYNRNFFAASLIGGLEFAYLKLKENQVFPMPDADPATTFFFRFESERKSVGPEIGLDMSYFLLPNFNVFLTSTGSILATRRTSLVAVQDDGTPEFVSKDESYWIVIPAVDIRFGLGYTCQLFCCGVNLQVGYEWINFFNGLDRVWFADDVASQESIIVYTNFCMHGPFVHVGVSF